MQQAVDSFLAWLVEEKGSTENTIAAYRNDLGQFLDFLSASTAVEAWAGATEADIRAYLAELQAREYAPATVARKMAAVRSFFHYLVFVEALDDDPTVQIDAGAKVRRSPERLPRQAAQRLWDSVPGDTPLGLRDRALIALVAGIGLKASQVVVLNLEDLGLQPENGLSCAGQAQVTIRVRGRRGQEEILTLSPPVAADLRSTASCGGPIRGQRPALAGQRGGGCDCGPAYSPVPQCPGKAVGPAGIVAGAKDAGRGGASGAAGSVRQ